MIDCLSEASTLVTLTACNVSSSVNKNYHFRQSERRTTLGGRTFINRSRMYSKTFDWNLPRPRHSFPTLRMLLCKHRVSLMLSLAHLAHERSRKNIFGIPHEISAFVPLFLMNLFDNVRYSLFLI